MYIGNLTLEFCVIHARRAQEEAARVEPRGLYSCTTSEKMPASVDACCYAGLFRAMIAVTKRLRPPMSPGGP